MSDLISGAVRMEMNNLRRKINIFFFNFDGKIVAGIKPDSSVLEICPPPCRSFFVRAN